MAGFQSLALQGNGFVMQAYQKAPAHPFARLHVYLEGDGRPWERGRMPSEDPTTRASVMLPLMALDPSPALYLARPCYNGHAHDVGCHQGLWTQARYGREVVEAMTQALQTYAERHQIQAWVLIGHSGGGSLALLLANRLAQTRAVVTLAANYDIDAWADHHHYLRLEASLNPAKQTDLGLEEWHLLARQDNIVPPALFEQALRQRRHSHVHITEGDHQQGWLTIWPWLLAQLSGIEQRQH
ncbi:MAG: hypothetical protein RL563_2523 [Pseudomonadota bacterium]